MWAMVKNTREHNTNLLKQFFKESLEADEEL
jgi:hypothetical protein